MAEKKQIPGKQFSYICEINEKGQRLDALLTDKLEITRSQVKILVDTGQVLVNDEQVKAGYRIKGNESILVTFPRKTEIKLEPENIALDIIYEDQDLMVIHKPADMVVHPGIDSTNGTLVNALLYYSPSLSRVGGALRPGIVHRLDKDTTGLMVVAKNDPTHLFLTKQMLARTTKRHYSALVYGKVEEDQGTISAPIGRNPKERTKMTVVSQGRKAITHYTVKERIGRRFTLVECRLETGRTHQIRVHLESINHPVVGDPVYGNWQQIFECKRQMLHADFLAFEHPHQGWLEFSISLPEDFQQAIKTAKEVS